MKTDSFAYRHLGPRSQDVKHMLEKIGYASLDELIDATIPASIRLKKPLNMPDAVREDEYTSHIAELAGKNKIFRSYIGLGYYNCHIPAVIRRNVLENPGWYTAYTPYQAEISQGRLEALINFQTMVCDLTGLEIANASMLDEGTAAAEAMMMCHRLHASAEKNNRFFVSAACHPQTIDIVRTRAKPLGIEVVVGDHRGFQADPGCFGVLVQDRKSTRLNSSHGS